MKKEVAELWSFALMCGKYVQVGRRLRIGDRYSVLGVLCDLSRLTVWMIRFAPRPYSFNSTQQVGVYFGEHAGLPEEVALWSGLTRRGAAQLASDNDSGISFEKLADYIDLHWGEL